MTCPSATSQPFNFFYALHSPFLFRSYSVGRRSVVESSSPWGPVGPTISVLFFFYFSKTSRYLALRNPFFYLLRARTYHCMSLCAVGGRDTVNLLDAQYMYIRLVRYVPRLCESKSPECFPVFDTRSHLVGYFRFTEVRGNGIVSSIRYKSSVPVFTPRLMPRVRRISSTIGARLFAALVHGRTRQLPLIACFFTVIHFFYVTGTFLASSRKYENLRERRIPESRGFNIVSRERCRKFRCALCLRFPFYVALT